MASKARQLSSGVSAGVGIRPGSWTTATRPSNPTSGQFGYNSTLGYMEWYNSSFSSWFPIYDPPGYEIQMFAWGAGGAGGYNAGTGGAGGAAAGYMLVTPTSSYAIVVGGGGQSRAPNAGPGTAPEGGGGLAGDLGYGGQGGGYSGIFVNSVSQLNAMLIAGGGGGGAYEGATGGAGGGTSGLAGGNGTEAGGGGGTQSAGGSSVSQTGSALQGGTSGPHSDDGGSGGGGGGYFGGGAGANSNPGSGGGGGSGYFNEQRVYTAILSAGSGVTPGDSTNSLRGTYGNGGASGNSAGNQGVVIIRYAGSQRGSGGTVVTANGVTTHTFTTSGTFTA